MQSSNNYMNPEQFTQVINAIPQLKIRKWKDLDIEFLFKIQYESALRPIEAIRLKKEDINLDERQIYLGQTKTTSEDYAVIPRGFIPQYTQYIESKEPGRLTRDLTYNTYRVWIKDLGKMLHIPAWTTPQSVTHEKTKGHIFRKSKGKDLVQELGYGLMPSISKHLRHSSPEITAKYYLKVTREAVKEVI